MKNNYMSFIVPCFNSEKTIQICINSILNQSKFNKSEIIIINDGSTDRTSKIINQYKNNNKIIIKTHSENMGLSQARNTGINSANGDILAFIDSDMELENNWLNKAMKIFNHKHIIGIMGQYTYPQNITLNQLDKYLYSSLRGAKKKYVNGDNIHFKYFLFSNTAIRRHVFNSLLGFDNQFKKYGGEDTDLAIRLYQLYPQGLYYFSDLISYHHSKKELHDYCNDMKTYGSINLHILIDKYPQHAEHLSGKWLTSIHGYLIFNRLIMSLINYILIFINMKFLIKYKIAYNVISGYRLNIKKK